MEIGALLFCHAAEQAEVIFFNCLLSTAVLKLALDTVAVQNQVGRRGTGKQRSNLVCQFGYITCQSGVFTFRVA